MWSRSDSVWSIAASTPTCSEASCVVRASSCSARSCESSSSRVRMLEEEQRRRPGRPARATPSDGSDGDRRGQQRRGQRLGRQHRHEDVGPDRGRERAVGDADGPGDEQRSSARSSTKKTPNTTEAKLRSSCGARPQARGPTSAADERVGGVNEQTLASAQLARQRTADRVDAHGRRAQRARRARGRGAPSPARAR